MNISIVWYPLLHVYRTTCTSIFSKSGDWKLGHMSYLRVVAPLSTRSVKERLKHKLDLLTNYESSYRTFATGMACWQFTFSPPDTWSQPIWTCTCSTFQDQSFSELIIIFPGYAVRVSLGTFSILLSEVYQYERMKSLHIVYNGGFQETFFPFCGNKVLPLAYL